MGSVSIFLSLSVFSVKLVTEVGRVHLAVGALPPNAYYEAEGGPKKCSDAHLFISVLAPLPCVLGRHLESRRGCFHQ